MSQSSETTSNRFAAGKLKKVAGCIAHSRATQIGCAGCGAIFFALQLFVCFVFVMVYKESYEAPPKAKYFLHSSAPFHAVRIPFNLRNGAIILPGELSGKKMECQFDTGCAPILWNKNLHLSGEETIRKSTIWDVADKKTPTREVILPSLRLGAYEVRGQSTWTMNPKPASKSMIEDLVRKHPLIGDEVFRNVVVTIDYRTKELIVRSPDYDFARQPVGKGAQVVSIVRTSTDLGRVYGVPVIEAQVNGIAARVQPDTGWVGGGWITSAYVKVIERSDKQRSKTASSHATDIEGNQVNVHNVQLRLGKTAKPIPGVPLVVHPRINARRDFDALAGYNVLRFFRITIDYPRQKMLLEPFDEKVIQIVPQGTLLTFVQEGHVILKKRFNYPAVIFHYADKTTTVTPL